MYYYYCIKWNSYSFPLMCRSSLIFPFFLSFLSFIYVFLKKNQNTPRPSEHPPVMGGKMSERLGWIKRLQIQNLFIYVLFYFVLMLSLEVCRSTRCSSDIFLVQQTTYYATGWQPRILLGMVEARSVNMENTTMLLTQ